MIDTTWLSQLLLKALNQTTRYLKFRLIIKILEHISKMIFDEDNDASEMNKSKIILKEAVIAN
jgi:hypothetical protein